MFYSCQSDTMWRTITFKKQNSFLFILMLDHFRGLGLRSTLLLWKMLLSPCKSQRSRSGTGRLWHPGVSHLKTCVPLMVHLASHVVVERGAQQVEERCHVERKPGQIRVWTVSFLVLAGVILHIRMGYGGGGGGWLGLQWVREKHPRITGLSLPWVGKIPWRRKWQPTPVFLPGKSNGWRSLAGYCPWGRKELDMTERLHFTSFLRPQKDLKDHLVQCLSFSDAQEDCDKFMIWELEQGPKAPGWVNGSLQDAIVFPCLLSCIESKLTHNPKL